MNEQQQQKRKRGQPKIVLTDEQLQTVTTCAALGLSQQSTVALLRLQHSVTFTQKTWQRMKKRDERLVVALEVGEAMSAKKAALTLYEAMDSDDVNVRIRAAMYWEKTRCGISEKVEIKQQTDITSSDDSLQQSGATPAQVHIFLPDNGRDGLCERLYDEDELP